MLVAYFQIFRDFHTQHVWSSSFYPRPVYPPAPCLEVTLTSSCSPHGPTFPFSSTFLLPFRFHLLRYKFFIVLEYCVLTCINFSFAPETRGEAELLYDLFLHYVEEYLWLLRNKFCPQQWLSCCSLHTVSGGTSSSRLVETLASRIFKFECISLQWEKN